MIAPVAAPTPVPMKVPFSRVESGCPEHAVTATIATATNKPLITDAAFLRTASSSRVSSFHACHGTPKYLQRTARHLGIGPYSFYLMGDRSTHFQQRLFQVRHYQH